MFISSSSLLCHLRKFSLASYLSFHKINKRENIISNKKRSVDEHDNINVYCLRDLTCTACDDCMKKG